MPKIIFDAAEKKDIPDHLFSQAKEIEGGGWELDASGILKKNKELLKDNAALSEKNAELDAAKQAAEASRDEWKGKANPKGQKLVPDDVAELGHAAKEANITKDEMPVLKTKADDLQKQIDADKEKKVREKAAQSIGKRFENFDEHATANGLKLVEKTEKVNDKDVTYYAVLGKDAEGKDTETRLTDYVKTKASHLPDADTKNVKRFGRQLPDNRQQTGNKFDRIREERQAEQKQSQFANASVADKFYGRVHTSQQVEQQ